MSKKPANPLQHMAQAFLVRVKYNNLKLSNNL